ncbi:MAG: ATP-dependent DNA helicase [Bacteroidetes bacterium]|jgi:ATP-dependent DNA helicase RecG|nr:ATP-dependent DNA helicase [Bacteroidota bacterium]MBT6836741.1 ATP-dependent DNA helicase [Bacteroidota bacterium]MBT7041080.1 ATP-dependent DNA helicase [Bacteroidota bacterium]MBT7493308.1 ATP-dependent DNA helicase [Bacteroidota bacterium]
MTKEQMLHIIYQGECETTEFKQSFNKEVIETIVAFANTKGGDILIGVNDKGSIIGTTINEETIQKWANEIKQTTEPSIFPAIADYEVNKNTVVCLKVDEFPLKPVSFKGKYYTRVHNSNHQLGLNQIVDLRMNSMNASFDTYPVRAKFEDLDHSALEFFNNRIQKSGRFKTSESLLSDFEKLGFVKDGELNRGAELLFGTHQTMIHLGRFKAPSVIIDDIAIRSPLILAVEEAMGFIKRNIALSFEFENELKRKERWQYPILAIRELLLNAIVHKDYSNPNDVIIKIYDKYIEISNPGYLMGGLTVDDLRKDNYQSKHSNSATKIISQSQILNKEY